MGTRAHKKSVSETGHFKIWRTTPRVIVVSVGVGLISWLVTDVMHYLLVPDIGRLRERLLAEGLSAIVVALLTAGLVHAANQRREAELLRMQVIAEMNHHIRNALAAISLTTESIQNQQCIRVIFDSVDHIDWTLRAILPRNTPLPEEDRDHLWFFRPRNNKQATGAANVARR
jgi:signal transduction histidine kinase